jgi:hypothetical protein
MRGLRAALTSMMVLGLLLASGNVAFAWGRDWCDDDPIFHFGAGSDRVVTQWHTGAVTSLRYVLEVPSNVPASVTEPAVRSVPNTVRIQRTLARWDGHGPLTAVLHVTASGTNGAPIDVRVSGASGPSDHAGTVGTTLTFALTLAARR